MARALKLDHEHCRGTRWLAHIVVTWWGYDLYLDYMNMGLGLSKQRWCFHGRTNISVSTTCGKATYWVCVENEWLSLLLVLDLVLGQRSEVPFYVLLALEISPSVFAFDLPSQAGKHTHGHAGPPIRPLPRNCHGALAAQWFCAKWSVGIRVGPSICCKSQVLCARRFVELISKNCWSLWLRTAYRHERCLQSAVRKTVQDPWNYSLWNKSAFF